jgi:hypothetical protein
MSFKNLTFSVDHVKISRHNFTSVWYLVQAQKESVLMYPWAHYAEVNGVKLLSVVIPAHVTTFMLFTVPSLKTREYKNRSLIYKVLICDDGG